VLLEPSDRMMTAGENRRSESSLASLLPEPHGGTPVVAVESTVNAIRYFKHLPALALAALPV
jgi:hypothetical protein